MLKSRVKEEAVIDAEGGGGEGGGDGGDGEGEAEGGGGENEAEGGGEGGFGVGSGRPGGRGSPLSTSGAEGGGDVGGETGSARGGGEGVCEGALPGGSGDGEAGTSGGVGTLSLFTLTRRGRWRIVCGGAKGSRSGGSSSPVVSCRARDPSGGLESRAGMSAPVQKRQSRASGRY